MKLELKKKIDGIAEVRDETDRNGLQIAIDLKKDANVELIINYLLKNTDMMVSYNYNMVAIVNRRPMVLGIMQILDAYIAHQREVITRRTQFDLRVAKERMHILEGLVKALSILDEVIKVIRASKNKGDAINNLVKEFDFTEKQADAIVTLRLYRLTNTDVEEIKAEMEEKEKQIEVWTQILENEEALKHVMKTELKLVKKEYATPRKTEIKEEVTEIKIDTTSLIPKEDCMVVITKEGYVKRVSLRSYGAANNDYTGLKDKDYPIGIYEANTMDTLLVFTDLGNFLYIPVYELPDLKWKDLGKHISNIIKISSDENIISSYLVKSFDEKIEFLTFTKNGIVKKTALSSFKVQRYSKPINLIKLKEKDRVISNVISKNEIFVTTSRGYGLRYLTEEVPITGLRGSGVKAINLKEDHVVSGNSFNDENFITIITDKGTAKRIKTEEFDIIARARRGVLAVRDVKTNPYHIINSFISNNKQEIGLITDEINFHKITEFPICDRYQTGTVITKEKIEKAFLKIDIQEKEEEPEDISLDKVDEKIMTIDDFLDDLKDS